MSKESLLVAGMLSPVSKGEIFRKIPPHVTLLSWIEIGDGQFQHFDTALFSIVSKHPPLRLIGEEEAMFGIDHSIRVRKLAQTGLDQIHRELRQVAGEIDPAILENEWSGDNYSPHVTYINGEGISRAQEIIIPEIHLISKKSDSRQKTVRASYRLGGE